MAGRADRIALPAGQDNKVTPLARRVEARVRSGGEIVYSPIVGRDGFGGALKFVPDPHRHAKSGDYGLAEPVFDRNAGLLGLDVRKMAPVLDGRIDQLITKEALFELLWQRLRERVGDRD